ncbi:MAG: ORC1-type DNA replication protein 2 [Methanonatronarchaeales archaeon]|nr:ORC1-type DNA replication protein 2 [Methanonatronarchaeales archaeon]
MSLLDEELGRPSVFRDESKLDFDYVPSKLPHREEHLRRLARIFRTVLENRVGASQSALVTGRVGSGKTAVTRRFGVMVRERREFDYVHVNCRRHNTASLAVYRVLQSFDSGHPKRGYSVEEMIDSLSRILRRRDRYLFLALDEVDCLMGKNGGDLIYSLSRMADDTSESRISLIYVTRDLSFRDQLDESTRSTLRSNVVELGPYSRDELRDILGQRVELAFYPDRVSPEAVELISDVASDWGNARFAIELLWKSGKKADDEVAERVVPEHARYAKGETHPEFRKEVLDGLDDNRLLVLLAVARLLRRSDRAYLTTGEVKEAYSRECENHGVKPRKHTQFWHYVKDLDRVGAVDADLSGEGERGTTTLLSLPDVPAEFLEKQLDEHLYR